MGGAHVHNKNWWIRKNFVEKVCIDASVVVLSTPSPLKIVRGGVLSQALDGIGL